MVSLNIKKMFFCGLLLIPILFSCNKNEQRDWALEINSTYSYKSNGDDCTESLYVEEENERFLWKFTTSNSGEDYCFSFDDLCYSIASFYRKDFNFYDGNNSEIIFEKAKDNEDCEFYTFTGNISIYIDYSKSTVDLKSIICSREYIISICGFKWFSDPDLYY